MGGDRGGYVRIQVTEADITKAESNNSMRCVVAQAIARTIPDASRISVDVQTVRWSAGNERFVFLTPYSVQGYVVAFDAGDKIEPFTFNLDNRKRIDVRKQTKTPAGKAVGRATERQRSARKRVERLDQQSLLPLPEPEQAVLTAQAEAAKAELVAAESNAEKVKAAYAGAVQVERLPESSPRKAPPRVHTTAERHYGHRVLRVNQG